MTVKKATAAEPTSANAAHEEQDPVNPQEKYDPETEELQPVQSDDQPEKAPPEQPQPEEEPQGIREVEPAPPEEDQVQRQMVPPTVTDKGKKYTSDPNWYPDPDKPLPRSF